MSSITTEQALELIEEFEEHLDSGNNPVGNWQTEIPYSLFLRNNNFVEYTRLFIEWVTEDK